MSLPLPLHYSDLLYKDPDAAVCACMARPRARGGQSHLESEPCNTSSPPSAVQTPPGTRGCGLNFYSPLGTEVWGRSLLVFHCFDVTSSTPCDFKVLRLAQSVKVTADEVISHGAVSEIADNANTSASAVVATETSCSDKAILNSESVQYLGHDEVIEGNKKRKSTPPDIT